MPELPAAQLSHPEKDALIAALTARLALADTRIASQDARIAALEARLNEQARPPKTPGNSSKPPSQGQKPDLPAPAADRPPRKSRPGAGRTLHPHLAFLVDEEGTASSLRGVRGVVAKHGLFCSLYTDRGSHYFFTPEGGGPVSKTVLTQFGGALKQLRRAHRSLSPRARGRSERAFETLQDRLPKELKLAGIDTVEAANRWLSESDIAEYNQRFAIAAEQEGSALVADAI